MTTLRGVILDVGGVLLIPDGEPVTEALDTMGVGFSPAFDVAHYLGIRAVDTLGEPEGRTDPWSTYLRGYVRALGVAASDEDGAVEILRQLWRQLRSIDLWRSVIERSLADLRALDGAGLALAIVSNSDGTVEEALRHNRICQVGEGPGVPVSVVVDSAVLGIAKPDPRIFRPALDVLDLPPDSIAYVGDSVIYDVAAATQAGLTPIHFDPWRLCDGSSHRHAARLGDLLS